MNVMEKVVMNLKKKTERRGGLYETLWWEEKELSLCCNLKDKKRTSSTICFPRITDVNKSKTANHLMKAQEGPWNEPTASLLKSPLSGQGTVVSLDMFLTKLKYDIFLVFS